MSATATGPHRRALLAGFTALAFADPARASVAPPSRHTAMVRSLIGQMTLDEKIGQLNQAPGGRQRALNSRIDAAQLDLVRKGGIGSYLHVAGADFLRELQRVAVQESRLKIPLLFGIDVIHGFRTIFPVPIGMAATFDPEIVKACSRVAAIETSVSGLHWTFTPMVDIARDPRWGRIVEGAGEDPYLGSRIAEAQITGLQGDSLAGKDVILACAKHFGAYGAANGGRDYDSADVSERTLQEVYLPPFHASVRAGAGSFMTAFNDIAGVPTTANQALVRGQLRDQWGYQGLVVSDWNAILELINHGVAETPAQAAALALKAGVDMDMAGGVYAGHLKIAVAADPSLMPYLDQAVGRVLMTKARLGLFDDPFRFGDAAREKTELNSPAHRAIAGEAARKAIVLLKNEGGLLPLSPAGKRIAVIGALADDASSALGSWRARGQVGDVKTLLAALREQSGATIDYQPGAAPRGNDASGIPAAVAAASAADVVLLVIGEDFDHSAEARSRSEITLPGVQSQLAEAVLATGKPVVVVLMNGRPIALTEILGKAGAALETWFLGVESGPAIVDILTGKVSPAGRLPAGLPRNAGTSPSFYAHMPSGRPADPDLAKDSARYHDVDIGPLYPFGHGLSYASFAYADLAMDHAIIDVGGEVAISLSVTNTGKVAADEVVQLYMRDPVASVARPIKELRGFIRVALKPGETRRVIFHLRAMQTALWKTADQWRIEAGRIDVMVGASSDDIRLRGSFTITGSATTMEPAASLLTRVTVS